MSKLPPPDPPVESPAWRALTAHARDLGSRHLRQLFADDSMRGRELRIEAGELYIDYAKHRVTRDTLTLLADLALEARVPDAIEALFTGGEVNPTEQRPALHTVLRAPRTEQLVVDGVDLVAEVHTVLDRMAVFAEAVRAGTWLGATGEPIRTVVNIGIGGSHLGPAMAYGALAARRHPTLECRFVSNVDGDDLWSTTRDLDPATTLFVVASKTFTTLETLTNARSARRWVLEGLDGHGDAVVSRHFVAVSTNTEAVTAFGIDPANMFGFWDWVGGRYSIWSAIGLPLMVAIGPDGFREFLAGAHTIDEHVRSAAIERNAAVTLALLGVWYRDFLGAASHAVVPYAHLLSALPDYLQQLEMESNGKSVTVDGRPVRAATAPVIWGTPGPNGQHAYFQLLHQGTELVPCDFIGFGRPAHGSADEHHDLLTANLLAQAEALAFGRTAEEVADSGVDGDLVAHRTFPGNRPSTVILAPALTPSVLGQLIALYEHKVFVQGVIWGINSFDQWGVELGKALAGRIGAELESGEDGSAHDSSTEELLRRYRALRT